MTTVPARFSSHLAAEVASQPAAWRAAIARVRTDPSVADRLPAAGERVAVLGCGTSLSVARAYAALREGSGLGVTDAWQASDHRLSRGYDRVVAITRSGTTSEVLGALAALADLSGGETPRVTVVTATPGTPVLDLGDPVLLPDLDEESVVSSRFATGLLMMLRAHLAATGSTAADTSETVLDQAIEDAEAALAEPDDTLELVRRPEQITFVGTGWASAIADEAALKLRESTQSWTESYLATEYRHGPISVAAPGRVVWAFGPLVAGFALDVGRTGATLVHHDVDPVADLVRVHRLCLLRAADRGLDPDRPHHLGRSVILDS